MTTTPEQRAKRAAYMREWTARNREKVLAAKRADYAANPEKYKERNRRNYAANRPARQAANRAAYLANREQRLAYEKARYPERARIRREKRLKIAGELLEAQNGLCKCGEPLAVEEAFIDHDHSCCPGQREYACGNCYRAALHPACNSIVGFIEENPDRLRSLADFLGTIVPG